jgi:hypothetical protein
VHCGTKSRPCLIADDPSPKRVKKSSKLQRLEEELKEQQLEFQALKEKLLEQEEVFQQATIAQEEEISSLRARVPADVTCCICQDSMLDSGHLPARLCSNGHYICATPCLPRLFESQSIIFKFNAKTHVPMVSVSDDMVSIDCPSCKVPVYLYTVKKMNDAFIYQCIWNKPEKCPYDGCCELFSGRAFVRHVLICDWRTLVCIYCGQDIRHNQLAMHVSSGCASLPCRFCSESSIRFDAKSLQAHLKIHGRHEDIRKSLLRNLNRVREIIEQSDGFSSLVTNNAPIGFNVLQESLYFNEALSRFVVHGEAETFSSFLIPSEVRTSDELMQHVSSGIAIDYSSQESDGNSSV